MRPAADLQELAIAICNRHTGVGADGWMHARSHPKAPDFDATIRLFNSDGSEPELSGNGTRCAALLLAREERGFAHPHPHRRGHQTSAARLARRTSSLK